MGVIQTGVDRLVGLVDSRKKISVDQAAKELGVGQLIIQEWAEFLEEEGLISIEYGLSKIFLVQRKLSKKDLEKKGKEYDDKKETFIRKVETGINALDSETESFEKLKDNYLQLKDELGGEMTKIHDEMKELQHYEELKKNIDEDIIKQRNEYQKIIQNINKQIGEEEQKYDKIIETIQAEKEKIEDEAKSLQSLEKEDEDLKQRLKSISKAIQGVDERVDEEKTVLDNSEKRIQHLIEIADQIEKDIKEKKKAIIEPVIKMSEEHKKKVLDIQDDILKKVKERKEEIEKFAEEGNIVTQRFEAFFDKKNNLESLFNKIEAQKKDLETAMEDLVKKARAFNLMSGQTDLKKFLLELEKRFVEQQEKKKEIKKNIEKLAKAIHMI
ncbi:hypothetical protein JW868_03845 [Candidatus Woesearchaeota archaeon]|nr:hypothetical protein [Candidatus Woesearchaeota archaeon]